MAKWEGYDAPEGYEYHQPPGVTEPQLRELSPEQKAIAEAAKEKKGKLPEDFPGYSALEAEGITTYAKLRKRLDGITEVPGIGDATAEKIREAMSHPADEEEAE